MREISMIFFTVVCVLSFSQQTVAQHYIGVKGGYGAGQARIEPKQFDINGLKVVDNAILLGMYSGGVTWKYYSTEKYLGGFEIDLEYMQRGFKEVDKLDPNMSYQRRVNTIMVPILLQPHFYILQRSARIFIDAGVTFSYNINSSDKTVSKTNGVIKEGSYEMKLYRDNRFGYGLCGGAGFSVLVDKLEFTAEGRYHLGYSDLYKNTTKYKGNPRRSPIDNIYITFGVSYRLGQGGILSPPSKKAVERMNKLETERLLKSVTAIESDIDNEANKLHEEPAIEAIPSGQPIVGKDEVIPEIKISEATTIESQAIEPTVLDPNQTVEKSAKQKIKKNKNNRRGEK